MVGRITLFWARESDVENSPVLQGTIEYPDGTKEKVSLWHNKHPRVTGGEFFTGQVIYEEELK